MVCGHKGSGMITVDGLPSAIRVGPYDIKIVFLPDDSDDYGHFLASELELGIQRQFASGAVAVDTFLHEILHAVWWAAALPRKRCEEERAVSQIAPSLTQVFRDHPELLTWMQKTLAANTKP